MVLGSSFLLEVQDALAPTFFQDRVQPLIESRCVSCHGPDKQKGQLRLDSREAMLKGGESGPVLIPGKPSESLLVQVVLHQKKDLEMPPKERLTPADIAVLERWIAAGAPWPQGHATNSAAAQKPGERVGDAWSDPKNPITRLFGGQRLDLWSFRPLARPILPSSATNPWVRSPLDAFILASLEKTGSQPAPEADRRTLIRRLTFDLTGLPPSPTEVAAFVSDPSPLAYEHLVDRLLASPRYGEQAARLWLDVIRYSDSNGFDWDEFRPKAWRFRDYVIRSFNADKPFDQLVREMLAGDELLAGPPTTPAEQDYLIATGYLRLGPQDNSSAAFNEQDRSRAELLADLTETTSSAFLGLSMSCCRCHDHKFDPLSQADHFRMRAFFEGVRPADDVPLDLAADQERIRAFNQNLERNIAPLEKDRQAILDRVRQSLREERLTKLSADERTLLEKPPEAPSDSDKSRLEGIRKKVEPSDKEVKAALAKREKEKAAEQTLAQQISKLKAQLKPWTHGLLMSENGEKIPVTRILFQGDYKSPRDPVEPGFPSALDPNPAPVVKPANPKTSGRRLALADWITHPKNPLTARVLVNRVWQQHFDRALVATPNDFGLAGSRPTHPELLDWLAEQFIQGGYSIKALHRTVVLSATYRQRSSRSWEDPPSVAPSPVQNGGQGALYATQSLRRLSAEQLRDALLLTSGQLQFRPGGPPAWPDLPPEVLQANPAFLDDNAEKTKGWYPSPAGDQHVRSVFLVQKRTVRVPFLETFDLPENSTSCARRTVSIVAPQAFALLNGALAVQSARALAERVSRESEAGSAAQIRRAFQLVLQRPPAPEELQECEQLLSQRSLTEVCRVLLNLNEFLYLD
jgi:hypothetical protein